MFTGQVLPELINFAKRLVIAVAVSARICPASAYALNVTDGRPCGVRNSLVSVFVL
jgi:hypothetical protein